MSRVLTGVQSSGIPHLGNLLGAILPAIELSKNNANESYYFIADLHSLTTLKDADMRRHNIKGTAAAWIACGFDTKKHTFYRQSKVPEVTELAWYLTCFAPYPMLANATAFKEKSDRLSNVNAGLFIYPVLQAADILGYDAEIIPVGKDQKQNLEITRDLAKTFNHQYGEIFVVPEAKIAENVMTIPGTDGQKMSKSYGNFINIFETEKILKKQVMSIVTDATPLEDPKDYENCNVFKIFQLVANDTDIKTMQENYSKGGYGYGHAKKALLGLLLEKFEQERMLFTKLMNDEEAIDQFLMAGEEQARATIAKVNERVRLALGFS